MLKVPTIEIFSRFQVEYTVRELQPLGNGHINDTYLAIDEGGISRYVLQKINRHVFKDVDILQNNILTVTSHIKRKMEIKGQTHFFRETLTFLPAADGKYYYYDGENYWRVCLYIAGSKTHEDISPDLAYSAGKAFGKFQSLLSDIPEGAIRETIPHFHDMEFRLQQLDNAIEKDAVKRLFPIKTMVKDIRERAQTLCLQTTLYREGKLKKRVNHCDTKVNNILFDNENKVLCVIDLDTVMPGFVLSDIGDFIRTACNTATEDEKNIEKIGVNMDIFKAYTRGYIETARDFLTPLEIKLLPYGGRLMTGMQTVRFLTDYLDGDTYYKIHFPEHNLQRTCAQYQLWQKLDAVSIDMDKFMEQFLSY
ncbi:MAG: aminoglycoside phosphotransferase family protein [Bacteroidales bacterium]|jgi:Ser/Thr protein kinase RdoA (MazF antagonist)|nr:aminoglycoside phosphotransferase family protein [Bacteroidales bacterium]